MKNYEVKWVIQLSAKNPQEAAKEAYDCIINGTSKFFTIVDQVSKKQTEVDLNEYPIED